jgi:hypothetical protein
MWKCVEYLSSSLYIVNAYIQSHPLYMYTYKPWPNLLCISVTRWWNLIATMGRLCKRYRENTCVLWSYQTVIVISADITALHEYYLTYIILLLCIEQVKDIYEQVCEVTQFNLCTLFTNDKHVRIYVICFDNGVDRIYHAQYK